MSTSNMVEMGVLVYQWRAMWYTAWSVIWRLAVNRGLCQGPITAIAAERPQVLHQVLYRSMQVITHTVNRPKKFPRRGFGHYY